MLRVTGKGILGYEFCDQTVTLYHAEYHPEFQCRRIVFRGAYFDSREVLSQDAVSQSKERRCFVLLPCGNGRPDWIESGNIMPLNQNLFTLEPGDRILRGEGPEITTRQQWSGFIPVNVPGLTVVKEVSAKEWKGVIRHVEAEAEWYKRW